MEYNYENKNKMDELKNNPENKKAQKKKWWLYVLFCLPIFVGFILYTTYCTLTPNYQQIYNNVVVSSDNSKTSVYTIDDSNKVLTSSLTLSSSNTYDSSSVNESLFTVDLTALRTLNNNYSKIAINFIFEANSGILTGQTRQTYPKIRGSIDDREQISVQESSDDYATYSMKEISVTDGKYFTVQIKSLGTTSGDTGTNEISFKNIRLSVLGAN